MNTIINIITWLSFGFYILGFLFLFITLMSTFREIKGLVLVLKQRQMVVFLVL